MISQDRTRSILIGFFVLSAVALLGGILLFLKPTFGDGALAFRVRFGNIEKMNVGTRVTLAGKPIGQVTRILPVSNSRNHLVAGNKEVYAYELELEVDSKTHLYDSDLFISQTSGLLGEKSVAIIPQPLMAKSHVIHHGDLIYAQSIPSMEDTVERIGKIAGRAEEAITSITKVVDGNASYWNEISVNLADVTRLLKDVLAEASGTHLITSLNTTIVRAGAIFAKIENYLQTIDHEGGVEDLLATIKQLRQVSENLNQKELITHLIEQITETMKSVDTLSQKVVLSWPKVESTLDSISGTSEKVTSIVNRVETISKNIEQGKGTLGRLLVQDDFYLDLEQTIARVNLLLADINNYGLLFQSNRTWKRQRVSKMDKMAQLKTPEEFEKFWKDGVYDIQNQLGRLVNLLTSSQPTSKSARGKGKAKELPNQAQEFRKALQGVLSTLNNLQQELVLFGDQLQESGREAEQASKK